MAESDTHDDPWRWPAFLLWCVFMTTGLMPEVVYFSLRRAGDVATQNAMINSPFVLYWALIAFVAFFVYDACRTRGDASAPARARAFTAAVLAMVAFLPVRMDEVIEYFRIMPAEQRNLLLGVVSLKSLAWLYLFGLVLRYYSGDPQVFVRLPTFLPSVRGTMRQEAPEAGRDARPPEPPEGVGKGLS